MPALFPPFAAQAFAVKQVIPVPGHLCDPQGIQLSFVEPKRGADSPPPLLSGPGYVDSPGKASIASVGTPPETT